MSCVCEIMTYLRSALPSNLQAYWLLANYNPKLPEPLVLRSLFVYILIVYIIFVLHE